MAAYSLYLFFKGHRLRLSSVNCFENFLFPQRNVVSYVTKKKKVKA